MPVDQSKSRRNVKDLDVNDLPTLGADIKGWTQSETIAFLDKVAVVQSNASKRTFDDTINIWRSVGLGITMRARKVHDSVESNDKLTPKQIKDVYVDLSKDKAWTWSDQYAVLYSHAYQYATDSEIKSWRGKDGAAWRESNAPKDRTISVNNVEYAVRYCRRNNVEQSNATGSGSSYKRPEIKGDAVKDEMDRMVNNINTGTDITLVAGVKLSTVIALSDDDVIAGLRMFYAEHKRRTLAADKQGTWGKGNESSSDDKSSDTSPPSPAESDLIAMLAEMRAEMAALKSATA